MLVFYISEWMYWIIYFIIFVLFGLLFYLYRIKKMMRFRLTFSQKIVLYSGFFILFLIIFIGGAIDLRTNFDIRNMLHDGTYHIAKGEIKDFKPIGCGSHLKESFNVENITFSYNGYSSDIFFHKQKCQNGPIQKNGQRVKIYYIKRNNENKIIKMWIYD